ncbi:MAG: rRNA processing protein RimM [Acidimicrobiales bacterium]|nr:rRNA processing protein RimM [Acidimicrobiales bacterium]
MINERLLEIGRIGKAHGLKGEVTVLITSDRPERTAPGAVWHLASGPVTVTAIRPFQQRWIALLAGTTTREAAEALSGEVVYGEAIDDPDALWVHELIGATVATPDGHEWGEVVAILANPADDLLELADGTLVPAGFVTDASGLPDRVVVDPPEGLLGAD